MQLDPQTAWPTGSVRNRLRSPSPSVTAGAVGGDAVAVSVGDGDAVIADVDGEATEGAGVGGGGHHVPLGGVIDAEPLLTIFHVSSTPVCSERGNIL